MHDRQRFRLRLGRYRTPRFKYRSIAWDEVRGYVEIVGMTDARIPWPLGKRGRAMPSPVVFKGLADAVRCEPAQAVANRGATGRGAWPGPRSRSANLLASRRLA